MKLVGLCGRARLEPCQKNRRAEGAFRALGRYRLQPTACRPSHATRFLRHTPSPPLSRAAIHARDPRKPSSSAGTYKSASRLRKRMRNLDCKPLLLTSLTTGTKCERARVHSCQKNRRREAPSSFDPARCDRPESRTRGIEPGPSRPPMPKPLALAGTPPLPATGYWLPATGYRLPL